MLDHILARQSSFYKYYLNTMKRGETVKVLKLNTLKRSAILVKELAKLNKSTNGCRTISLLFQLQLVLQS